MIESRNYEFAYHITTQLDEARVPQIQQEIEAIVAKHGGVIIASQSPQPKKLSYPIKHQSQSFFGWVQFTTEDEKVLAELDEHARLHPEVLRHVTLRLEHESDKRAAKQAEHLERKAAKQAREGATQKKTATEKKSEDTGKLEKQLEDIIGNL